MEDNLQLLRIFLRFRDISVCLICKRMVSEVTTGVQHFHTWQNHLYLQVCSTKSLETVHIKTPRDTEHFMLSNHGSEV